MQRGLEFRFLPLGGLVAALAIAFAMGSQRARAQDPEDVRGARGRETAEAPGEGEIEGEGESSPADPPRYLALASAGVPLRLTVEDDFGQERLGASFVDVLAGYVLSGGDYRHGFGIGVSWNLGRDGGYVAPIYTADQIAIMPAYLAYIQLSRDAAVLGHLGVPIVIRGGVGPGLEVGASLLFHLFAGAGVFAEVDLAGFAAGDASMSVLASLEAGIMLNYEVLP
jgi:hypothetical protein